MKKICLAWMLGLFATTASAYMPNFAAHKHCQFLTALGHCTPAPAEFAHYPSPEQQVEYYGPNNKARFYYGDIADVTQTHAPHSKQVNYYGKTTVELDHYAKTNKKTQFYAPISRQVQNYGEITSKTEYYGEYPLPAANHYGKIALEELFYGNTSRIQFTYAPTPAQMNIYAPFLQKIFYYGPVPGMQPTHSCVDFSFDSLGDPNVLQSSCEFSPAQMQVE